MIRQFALCCFVLLGVTAFAPAPLPRRSQRDSEVLSVQALTGSWRAVSLYNTPKVEPLDPVSNGVSVITVTAQGRWIFGREGQSQGYDVRTDTSKHPAEIDFINPGSTEPYGRGLIRRDGNGIRVIYNWGAQRPTGWDNQPNGYWGITLVRE